MFYMSLSITINIALYLLLNRCLVSKWQGRSYWSLTPAWLRCLIAWPSMFGSHSIVVLRGDGDKDRNPRGRA